MPIRAPKSNPVLYRTPLNKERLHALNSENVIIVDFKNKAKK